MHPPEFARIRMSEENMLFAEHLTEHVLQFYSLFRRERIYLPFQPALINCSYLVGDNLTVTTSNMASHTEGVAMNRRSNGNDNDSCKILVKFLWTYHYARTHFLHFCTYCGIKVNPTDVKLIHHCHSSTLSSSNTSAAINWSSPFWWALRAAADHPFRTSGLEVSSANAIRRMSRSALRAFCMATSLSKMGLSSRSSSARSCMVVIIVIVRIPLAKVQYFFEI